MVAATAARGYNAVPFETEANLQTLPLGWAQRLFNRNNGNEFLDAMKYETNR
jgi:hypothetical protein